jgi:TolB protein
MSTVTRYGSSGEKVRDLQDRLRKAGFDPGESDGVYGKRTRGAVQKFQRAQGLNSDGVAGTKTFGALDKSPPQTRSQQDQFATRRPQPTTALPSPEAPRSDSALLRPSTAQRAEPAEGEGQRPGQAQGWSPKQPLAAPFTPGPAPAPTQAPAPPPAQAPVPPPATPGPSATPVIDSPGLNVTQRTTLPIPLSGSLQNAAWSPDGKTIAFTRFRDGYNKGPADVFTYNAETKKLTQLAADGNQNVSQPGSTWTKDGRIVFSSDKSGHEEIYAIKADGSQAKPTQLTSHPNMQVYEPSISPDGKAVAFESHHLEQAGGGRIAIHALDGSGAERFITPNGEDDRQPNWSPAGDKIVYQRRTGSEWNVWTYDVNSGQHKQLTTGGGATDATFSPDGKSILFSKGVHDDDYANLFAIPVGGGSARQITSYAGYDGAPSWSPNGRYVAMESSPRDPDGGGGTKIVLAPVPRT